MTGEILGIGVDIVDPARIARVRARQDIMGHVMADEEEFLFPLSDGDAANIWATKEAVAKTLGTGFWQEGVRWTDIRLRPDGGVAFHGPAAVLAGECIVDIERKQVGGYLVVTAIRRRGQAH